MSLKIENSRRNDESRPVCMDQGMDLYVTRAQN
jgi:hypothetical protein